MKILFEIDFFKMLPQQKNCSKFESLKWLTEYKTKLQCAPRLNPGLMSCTDPALFSPSYTYISTWKPKIYTYKNST